MFVISPVIYGCLKKNHSHCYIKYLGKAKDHKNAIFFLYSLKTNISMDGIALPDAVNSWLCTHRFQCGEPDFQWDLLGCLEGGELCGDLSPERLGCVGHRAPSCSSLASTCKVRHNGRIAPRVSGVEMFSSPVESEASLFPAQSRSVRYSGTLN